MPTSCTECKNAGCCPFWKGERINARNECERECPINYCTLMAVMINRGEDIAVNCEKFQKNIKFV